MDLPETRRIEQALAIGATGATHGTDEEDVAPVADRVVAAFVAIQDALVPIVGRLGVAALCARSLHLAAATHPWLGGEGPVDPGTIDFEPLLAALRCQTRAAAAAGGATLLRTFNDLLASLIGAPLTERLLCPVWASLLGADPAQDTSP